MRIEAVRKARSCEPVARLRAGTRTGTARAADALAHPAAHGVRQLTQASPPDRGQLCVSEVAAWGFGPAFGGGPSNCRCSTSRPPRSRRRPASKTRGKLCPRGTRRRDVGEKDFRGAPVEKASVSAGAPKPKVPDPPPTPAAEAMNRAFHQALARSRHSEPPFRRLRIYAYDPGQQTDPTMFT